jgi:Leucine-rich repeat (LRR) protein
MKCLESSPFSSLLDMSLLFSSHKTIETFIIENKNVSTLISLNTLTQIKYLNITHNSIGYVDERSFQGMTDLVSLSLSDNQLKSVESRSFHRARKLKKLFLFSNSLKVLREFSFANLSVLEYLDLHDNDIDTIEASAFYDLIRLKTLYISGNKLKFITQMTFKHLTGTMDVLYIGENEIDDIESYSFSNMIGLRYLHIEINQLKFVRNKTFFNLGDLKMLDMSQNEISALESNSFENMKSLESLKLGTNDIERIESDAFVSIENLKTLQLSKNQLSSIPKNLLLNFPHLEILYLNSNEFKKFDVNVGDSLRELDISYNDIAVFEQNSFENSRNLSKLKIKWNKMVEIECVRELKNLVDLDLAYNRLIKISKKLFENFTVINSLDLSYNYLDGFGENAFLGLDNLKMLHLSSNYIKILSRNFLNHLNSLQILNLNKNGLKHVEPFSFRNLRNLSELNLQSNKLSGFVENSTLYNLTNLRVLNLNLNYFTSINESLKSNLKHLESLETLLMRNNLIEYLNENDFEFNPYLKEIDLNFNRIKFIHFDTFQSLRNLTSLSLSRTQLDYVNLNILNGLKMTKIDFSFNNISFDQFILMDKLIEIDMENVNFLTRNYSFEIFFSLNLKSIDLSNNSLSTNHFQYISKMYQLEVLELCQVGLQSMAQINFTNLPKLIKINLSFNNLTQILYESLAYLLYLEHLDLSFNRIDFIGERIFSTNIGNSERKKLKYLNLQSNLLVSVGDLFLNFLKLEIIRLSENNLKKIPYFDSQFKGQRTLSDIYLNRNSLTSIESLSSWLNSVKNLYLDYNKISFIQDNAFLHLKNLQTLSISNNFLQNLTSNNFFYLYNLKFLFLGFNKIESLETKTFQNLNKLVKLDLSFNRLLSIDPNLFRGLDNLEDLNLQSKTRIQLNNQSFAYLKSLTNFYLNVSMLDNFECIFMHTIERILQRKISHRYIFYKSLNTLDSSNFQMKKSKCDLKFRLLQFKIHYNLKYDYENELFYEECKSSLIKGENFYENTLRKCLNTFELVLKAENDIEAISNRFLNVVKDYRYLVTIGCLILLLSLVGALFLFGFF